MLFWTLSEGIVSFIVPLKIEETGLSDTMMGIILGTSSIAGAVFDLVAVRLFKDTYYKRIFGAMFALCLIFPLILMQATTPLLFVLAMVVWGVYYDLRNIGSFDYIARTTDHRGNTKSFGIIQVFSSIGWVLGPIIVGFLVGEQVGWESFAAIYVFLALALFFFLILVFSTKKRVLHEHKGEEKECRRGTWSEIRMMGDVGRVLFPALLVIFCLNFIDAFFWSIGPLFAEEIGLGGFAGFFMTAWSLPALLLGWWAGEFAAEHGKERTAYYSLLIGSLFLIPLFFAASGIAVIAVVFVAASFISVSWPAIQGAFADYINQREDLEKEIEGLEDLYTNLGYVFGPISAGMLADAFGYHTAFGVLGILITLVTIVLIILGKKRIRLAKNAPALVCDVPPLERRGA